MHDLMTFLSEHWKAILAAIAAVAGAGIVFRFRIQRQSGSSSSSDQRRAKAGGDIIGRDKTTKN